MVARTAYTGAEQFFAAVLAFSRGEAGGDVTSAVPVPDPRRGSPQ
jgi:hypothetical protein